MKYLKKETNQNTGLLKTWNGGYQALSHLMDNQTVSIHFSTLDRICDILGCEPGDIIVRKKVKK